MGNYALVASIAALGCSDQKPPNVIVHFPDAGAPTVNVQVPPAQVTVEPAQPEVTVAPGSNPPVNVEVQVPEQDAPVVNVTVPEPKVEVVVVETAKACDRAFESCVAVAVANIAPCNNREQHTAFAVCGDAFVECDAEANRNQSACYDAQGACFENRDAVARECQSSCDDELNANSLVCVDGRQVDLTACDVLNNELNRVCDGAYTSELDACLTPAEDGFVACQNRAREDETTCSNPIESALITCRADCTADNDFCSQGDVVCQLCQNDCNNVSNVARNVCSAQNAEALRSCDEIFSDSRDACNLSAREAGDNCRLSIDSTCNLEVELNYDTCSRTAFSDRNDCFSECSGLPAEDPACGVDCSVRFSPDFALCAGDQERCLVQELRAAASRCDDEINARIQGCAEQAVECEEAQQ